MGLVGRFQELRLLEQVLASNRAEFLALYGRRRVGKTYLIREFFGKKKNCLFFNVTGLKDGAYQDQITHFLQRIGEIFLGGIVPKTNETWDGAFKLLTDLINKATESRKIIIFLDELPWLATKRSKLLQILDYYWNQYWVTDKRIKLIVCGSSASWIIDKIINSKGGLHNRVTHTICLQPFTLAEVKAFFEANKIKLSIKQIIEIYMVTGGIPYYLLKVEPGMSAVQAIEHLAFQRDALLLNEFNNLFSSLFEDSAAHIEILEKIAYYRSGVSQEYLFKLLKHTVKGNTGLSRLKALEEAGFIIGFVPHFHKKRGIYYRVIDEYTLFYLHWLAPLKDTQMAKSLSSGYWSSITQTPRWFAWAGYAFEALCYKHLPQIRQVLNLPPTAVPNAWRYVPNKIDKAGSSGAQIDLLFDREDDCITVCEIKYGNKLFTIDSQYANVLSHKMKVFQEQTRTKKHLFLAMIVVEGVKNNTYAKNLVDNVVTIHDLFQGS